MKRLVEEISRGDEQAVAEFYKTYSPKVLKYLLQKVSPEDAADLLHLIFFEAIDKIYTLQNKDNLQAWLYRLAHNKIVDHYRKKKIKSIVLSQLPFFEIVDSKMNEPEFILEKNRIRDRIELAMRSLSDKYRNILILHYEEQLPIREIAVVLNLSPKATESLLFRARQSFKQAYGRA